MVRRGEAVCGGCNLSGPPGYVRYCRACDHEFRLPNPEQAARAAEFAARSAEMQRELGFSDQR